MAELEIGPLNAIPPGEGRTFSTPGEKDLAYCRHLITRMLSGPGFWTRLVGPFTNPVDPSIDNVPNYCDVVKKPAWANERPPTRSSATMMEKRGRAFIPGAIIDAISAAFGPWTAIMP